MNNHDKVIDALTLRLNYNVPEISPQLTNRQIAEIIINDIGQNTVEGSERTITTPKQKLITLYTPELEFKHVREKMLYKAAEKVYFATLPQDKWNTFVESWPNLSDLNAEEQQVFRDMVMTGAKLLKEKYFPNEDITAARAINNDKVIKKIIAAFDETFGVISPQKSNEDIAIHCFANTQLFYSRFTDAIKPLGFLSKTDLENRDVRKKVLNEMAENVYFYTVPNEEWNTFPEAKPALDKLDKHEQQKFRDIINITIDYANSNKTTFVSKIKDLRNAFLKKSTDPKDTLTM